MSVVYSRLNKALIACESALSNPTDWYNACSRVSNVLTSMGRFDEASQWNSMAIATSPNVVHYHAKAAILYTIQEDWDKAIATYKQVLELDPNYADAHRSLARLYSHLDKLELELHHWYELLTQRPELGTPERNYKLGQSFQEQGNLDRAAICYERVIEQNDQYWTAYYNLADVRGQQKQWEKVVDCYEQVIRKDATQVQAFHKLGQLWLQQKEYDQAISKFRAATKLDPKFPWSYLGLVQTFLKLEQWDEAIATCRAIISFVEEFPWTYSHMGKAFMAKGEEIQAIACYQKVCQLRGWDECLWRDYQFTQDGFSHQIPLWTAHLQPMTHQANLAALEIGSSQGMTACWLLDSILTDETSHITCIDQTFTERFKHNIYKADAEQQKVTQREGKPHPILESLAASTYDIILVQDRCKQANFIRKDTRLSWPLLKPEGIMFFKDYGWQHPEGPDQSPKTGIDQFLSSISGQFKILHQAYQLIIKKTDAP